jgi:hypothetical protein
MLEERANTEDVEEAVVRLLAASAPETPDAVVDQVEAEHPELPRSDVKDELVSMLNRGILQLTVEGRLRLTR